MEFANIGLIGLAVMGENLVMNMLNHNISVAVYNRTTQKVDDFVNDRAKGKAVIGTYSISELVSKLEKPRKVMFMVKSGEAPDALIEQLLPLLDRGDIIIDGGNNNFQDTCRRVAYVESKGLLFIGTGISGGEEGALNGPSIMPGGSAEAWPLVQSIFQSISATVCDSPCCAWIGPSGAGHFVKMVHNGIEYGDMQLICEVYHMMRDMLHMSCEEMHHVFTQWNSSELSSYLIEITGDILAYKDKDGSPLVEKIMDVAGQKGTGKWTSIAALHEDVPLTLISESVFSRCLSANKDGRVEACNKYKKQLNTCNVNKEPFVADLKKALYASKIISYAQGYELLKQAANSYAWELNLGEVALIWRGGCIIRSSFLNKINEAYVNDKNLNSLLLDDYFKNEIMESLDAWRRVVSSAVLSGVAVPAMSSALSYFDGFTTEKLPANLLQAQRDYFGAHTYERTDAPRGVFHHTDWTGCGGKTTASTYDYK